MNALPTKVNYRIKSKKYLLISLFIGFLRKKGVLHNFVNNRYDYAKENDLSEIRSGKSKIENLIAHLKHSIPMNWVSSCFSWDQTPEDHNFWYNVFKEWSDLVVYEIGLVRIGDRWLETITDMHIEKIKHYYLFGSNKKRGN